MRLKKNILFLMILLFSIVLFASAEGHGQAEHGFDWAGFIGKVINSTLLFGGLYYLLKKPILLFLNTKTKEVRDDIESREAKIKDAKNELAQILNHLESIEKDINEMKAEALKNGKIEKEKIEKSAELETKRINEQVEAEINNKINRAVKNLRVKIADMIIDKFRVSISGKLDKKTHEKIIDKNIEISGEMMVNTTEARR